MKQAVPQQPYDKDRYLSDSRQCGGSKNPNCAASTEVIDLKPGRIIQPTITHYDSFYKIFFSVLSLKKAEKSHIPFHEVNLTPRK